MRSRRPEVRCELVHYGRPTGDVFVLPVDPTDHDRTDALLRHHLAGAIRGHGSNPATAARDYHLQVKRLDLPQDPTTIVRLT